MIPFQLCGFNGDERDYFPFPQSGPILGTPVTFTFEEYVKQIWRRRAFDVSVSDDGPAGPHSFSGTVNNHINGISEERIFEFARQSANLPGAGTYLDGSPGGIPNNVIVFYYGHYSWTPDAFSPSMLFQTFYTSSNPSTGPLSALTCTFLGANIPQYEPAGTGATGSMNITTPAANGFWSWDGHFDTVTGAPI